MTNTDNKTTKFSFYKAPVTNTLPHKNITLTDVFNYITGKYCKQQTLMLRSIADKKQNRKYKASNFHYATFSGIFKTRNESSLIEHSGLIAIDFDHLDALEETKLLLLKDPFFVTELLFISPNGNGLKWIIEIDIEKCTHAEYFQAILNYFKSTYSKDVSKAIDINCKDVPRATFLSYDSTAILHAKHLGENEENITPKSEYLEFIPSQWLTIPKNKKSITTWQNYSVSDTKVRKTLTTRHEAEVIIRRIENYAIDLTHTHENWINVGFALADEFGETGRGYFHRLSFFYSGYKSHECDEQFDKCLKSKKTGITIKTLFYLAKGAGVNLRV